MRCSLITSTHRYTFSCSLLSGKCDNNNELLCKRRHISFFSHKSEEAVRGDRKMMHICKWVHPSLRSLFCNPSKKSIAVTIHSSHYSLPAHRQAHIFKWKFLTLTVHKKLAVLRQRERLIIQRCSLQSITTHALWRSDQQHLFKTYCSEREVEDAR